MLFLLLSKEAYKLIIEIPIEKLFLRNEKLAFQHL